MQESLKTSQDIAINQPHLSERFKAFLEKNGNIRSFYEFMGYALYDEIEGYYTSPKSHRVGKEGDFITSISVGSTFSKLIIEAVKSILGKRGESRFTFIEYGSEDGTFAEDFLTHWDDSAGKLDSYVSIELSDQKRAHLTERFQDSPQFQAHAQLPPQDGFVIFFANEVLDAFPVHRIKNTSDSWQEMGISLKDDVIEEVLLPISAPLLLNAIERIPANLPEGYQTELCIDYPAFFSEIRQQVPSFHGLFIDYYFTEADYFSEHRTDGTLQTYSKHHKNSSPYEGIGQTDLSCHVNYDAVKRAATEAGCHVSSARPQGSYLTENGKKWLLSQSPENEGFQKSINEFKTLTMPQFFGAKFQVVEISR